MEMTFEKATISHLETIYGWLAEPHVREFWDNTQEHKSDILNFVTGRNEPSRYADGKYVYWIASMNGHPFAMIMTIEETRESDINTIKLMHLSITGTTYGMDFMIGDKEYVGKGLAAKTIENFTEYFVKEYDFLADTFLIDPSTSNTKAKHVYLKAGFEYIGDFIMGGNVSGAGKKHHLLCKRLFVPIDREPSSLPFMGICKHFNLGKPQKFRRVFGGLLHTMWQLETDKGMFAIKQLAQHIDLSSEQVLKGYELSETVATVFAVRGIKAIAALAKAGKYVFIIDGRGYLVFAWTCAKASERNLLNEVQATQISRVLAQMHMLNLNVVGLEHGTFDILDYKKFPALVQKAKEHSLPFVSILEANLERLVDCCIKYHAAIELLSKHTVISHADLDQKNVLWDATNTPVLIDWESARRLNPTYEIVNAALDWSLFATSFSRELFSKMFSTYKETGGIIDKNVLESAFWGALGNMMNWLLYNLERSVCLENQEQQLMGLEQVNMVLPTILRLKTELPELLELASQA